VGKIFNREEDREMVQNDKKEERGNKNKESALKKKVDFTLFAPEAREVFLVGEFNQWDTRSMPMKRDKKGVWKCKTKLPSGHYEYKFYVDGNWLEDIKGSEAVFNPFGTQNLVMEV
jgi:1,4-alpha-glucan branching enzyme